MTSFARIQSQGRTYFINPENVSYVVTDGRACHLAFDAGHTVRIDSSIAEVVSALQEAK